MSTKTKIQNKTIFQVWMLEESDTIQALAKSFGERICVEEFVRAVESESKACVKRTLSAVLHLFLSQIVAADMVYFIANGMISPVIAKKFADMQRAVVRDLAPKAMDLVDSFDVKPWMIYAPIAHDWAKYNGVDNRGEVVGVSYSRL